MHCGLLVFLMNGANSPFELTFEKRPNYLFARVNADTISGDVALQYLSDIANECSQSGYDKVLIVRDIPAMLDTGTLFFTTGEFLEMIGPTQVAFVNPHSSIQQSMDFAIMIGTNRGANYRLFEDEAEAEKWLLAD